MRHEKSNKSLVRYIKVKRKMDEFIRKYTLIETFEKIKDSLIKDECDEFKKDGLFNKHVNYNIKTWH